MLPENYVSEEDRYLQVVLNTYPELRFRVIRLLNGYRELFKIAIEEAEGTSVDMADIVISLSKKEQELTRLGLPLLNTPEEWNAFWQEERLRKRDLDQPTLA